jgi:tetratricopeptide (TPR) repeat protein
MGLEESGVKKYIRVSNQDWVLAFILFLAILGTYFQCLPYPFLNLDDSAYITDSSFIRDLSWKGICRIFSEPIVGNYFPLQILSYAIDYQIWHIQPFGYRLHNVLLHILNAILIFLLLKKIFANSWISFLSALFFGLHPVNVESVTWVAERKNVLSLALLLLSFLAYLSYLAEHRILRRKGFYLASLFLFLLALLAKISAVVLPFLFLLYDTCFAHRKRWEMIRDKIPFLILALLFSLITIWTYRNLKEMVDFHGGSPYTNFLAMVNVFVEYIIYLVVPVYLDHYYYTRIPATIIDPQVLLSLVAILLFALLAWRSFRKDRFFFFWFAWFFLSLLPVLNIFPIAILRADRYMYLPAIGFFFFLSWGLFQVTRAKWRRLSLPLFLFGTLLVTGSYAFLTVERNQLWRDREVFWQENLKKFPGSVMAIKTIGHAYIDRGKLDTAISYFQNGLEEVPNNVALLNGLAIAYQNKGELKKAEEILLEAGRIDPKDSAVCHNLGLIYLQRGEIEKARYYAQRAIELDPMNHAVHTQLGVIYFHLNRWDEAIPELKKAIELSPGTIQTYLNLAMIYNLEGYPEKAEFYLKKGLEYVPRSHAANLMLGKICLEQKKIQQARHYVSQAYQLRPDDPETIHFMGLLTQREADGYFQRAQQIQTQGMRVEPIPGKGPDRRAP